MTAEYLIYFVTTPIGGIFLQTHTWDTTHTGCERCKYSKDRSTIKGTLNEEQCSSRPYVNSGCHCGTDVQDGPFTRAPDVNLVTIRVYGLKLRKPYRKPIFPQRNAYVLWHLVTDVVDEVASFRYDIPLVSQCREECDL
jgi:hypothetical protein